MTSTTKIGDRGLEGVAACRIVDEHVEARGRRAQQHRGRALPTGFGQQTTSDLIGPGHGALEGSRQFDASHAPLPEHLRQGRSGLPYQDCRVRAVGGHRP